MATSAVPVASCALPTVTTCIPAALAAAMPAGESSQARQSPGATPSLAAAARKPSGAGLPFATRSEEHTSELQSLIRISYAVFCLKKKILYSLSFLSYFFFLFFSLILLYFLFLLFFFFFFIF